MQIEIVYALKYEQFFYTEEVSDGCTVQNALDKSQLLHDFPDLDISNVGIFARPVKKDDILKNGDRIEVYRPLKVDPKARRRERSKK